jgi:hypothetical protein
VRKTRYAKTTHLPIESLLHFLAVLSTACKSRRRQSCRYQASFRLISEPEMSWQQPRREQGVESSTILGKVSTSLDAVSYIIAFFLIDALTFGRLPATPAPTSKENTGYMGAKSSSSSSLSWRSVSEGDDATKSGSNPGKHLQSTQTSRARNSSECSMYDARQQATSDIVEKDPSRLSPTGSADRSLHHYQKKIFGRQVSVISPSHAPRITSSSFLFYFR